MAVVEEPMIEKQKTFKAEMSIPVILTNSKWKRITGRLLVYIQKDMAFNTRPPLVYGNRILFKKQIMRITNSGNPGSFDIQRFYHFQHIDFQIYLKNDEYKILPGSSKNPFKELLYAVQGQIVSILQKNIKGDKERGLGEALLIGYRNDLDKALVQAYTNTGVVHIIAISGLHLALIYGLLRFLMRGILIKKAPWAKPIIMLIFLWGFSFVSGASPSVLRSAMMFTCMVVGESIAKKNSIYNTLAASAFLLLCYNPCWLWDAGFQLSYAAVASIVIFMKAVYNLFKPQFKAFDILWKSVSLTLSAQILTLPICIYQFHQFPNYFLLSNLIAVPLSSLVLLGELLVCFIAFLPAVAVHVGHLVQQMIRLLNWYIENIAALPFSVWENLKISCPQVFMLYLTLAGMGFWFLRKDARGYWLGFGTFTLFLLIRAEAFYSMSKQELLIVYNIPFCQAIDCVSGSTVTCKAFGIDGKNGFREQLYIRPARMQFRVNTIRWMDSISGLGSFYQWRTKRLLVIDQSGSRISSELPIRVEFIVLSKNTQASLRNLSSVFDCHLWIMDASNSSGSIGRWKQECRILGLNYYSVADKGAFVMNAD